MSQAVAVSVIIPARNAAATLGDTLQALYAQQGIGPFEIVVADNGSWDETATVALRWAAHAPAHGGRLRLADASDRRGANAARNQGVALATGRLLLFCDADDIPAPGYVAAMAAALESADGAAGRLEFTRLNPGWSGSAQASGLALEGPDHAPIPIGACSGWRRELFERLGGFDERFASGCDELEFGLRACREGARVVEAPEALLHKRERSDPGALFQQYCRYGAARPLLCKRFPDLAQRRSAWAAAREWAWATRRLARHGLSDRRAVKTLAKNAGRLLGSVRHGCWAP